METTTSCFGDENASLTTADFAASAVSWCSDGKRLFAWGPTGLKTLDSQTGKVLQELPGYGSGRSVRAPSISADGRLVAFSYWDRSLIRLFRLADGKMLGTVLPMVGGGDVFISPNGHYRGPAGVEKKLVYVVETDAGQEMLTPEEFTKRYSWKNDPAKVMPAAP